MRKAYETDQNLRNLRQSLQTMDESRKEEQMRQMQEMQKTQSILSQVLQKRSFTQERVSNLDSLPQQLRA